MISGATSSTTCRLSFPSFTLSSTPSPVPRPFLLPLKPHLLTFHTHKSLITTSIKSIDVDKQEQPLSSEPIEDEYSESEQEQEVNTRKGLEEKFAVINTGVYECRSCGYNYNESSGDPSYPVPPGLPFDKLPDDWRCPTCGASQSFFQSKSLEIAGFAQNQQFGLGGNTLTSGQKALLIYGGLLLGFALFLSGYFLQ